MGWVALGRCAGGGGRLSSILSLSLTSLASSFIFTFLCILTLAFTLVTLARAEDIFEEGKSDKEILDNLLLSTRYDKRLLPPVQDADFCCGMRWPGDTTGLTNQSSIFSNDLENQNKNQNNNHYTSHQYLRTHLRGTLTVNVSVLLLSLASPDESSLKYEVEFLLQQQWYDPRLRYSNRSRYEYLNAIHHYEDIWLPDTYFIMHGDFKDPIIPVHFALRIYRNGTVNYLMRRHLIISCQGSLNIFPFDDPLCSFAIESISYEQTAITYVWKNDEGTLRTSPSLTSLNAYLIKNQTITCPIKVSWRADGQIMVDEDELDDFGKFKCSLCQRRFEEQGNYSCLKVDLIFTRDRSFYFTTVFIPGIILVTSSFITFWLEWNAVPARVMIGVTTMLNFFTTSNGFRGTLPVVSNLTAMNVWDGVCMCFIYASLLEFVCVNYVGRKRPMHNVVYRPGENPVTQLRKKDPPHPIRVAKTIDVIARITFPIAYFMFLTFFFIHYKGTS
ncbi:pH-sensitive chloride channel 1 isoform X13 [Anoplolepis gracilipes]|uniref:pH-sensitive chloride channel 1 isoform X13 n=1 Tax=Anoplolepis gracilipes TaxID=354296 RepID=UPI003B9F25E8